MLGGEETIILCAEMSVKVSGVYLVPSQVLTDKSGNNTVTKTKTVAIVAPHRSNSLDYLNFEEKRQIIASSLSLSDFLHVGSNATKEIKEIKDGVATVIVGEFFNYVLLVLILSCNGPFY